MQTIATVIILLAVVTALAEVTDRIRIPYPILLVLAGIGIGFVPGLPTISLNPEIVFLLFLPPVLYAAAWNTSWPDFKREKRPITLLAIGCVAFTTCAVAWVTHTFIPGFNWAESFVLGAIISPPDAVAATAATRGLSVPRRVITILEGESLVNDASGLIAYRYAVVATMTGAFNLAEAGLQFVWVALAGVAIGFAMGFVIKWVHRITPNNPTTDTTLTFITPFISYLSAEALHVSGVLAVVTTGLYLTRCSSELFSQQTRLQANGSWNTALFILNGVIFILIGLQLPEIIRGIGDASFWVWKYALIVCGTVIIGRLIWVYPFTYLPRWLSKRIRNTEPFPHPKLVTIVAWSGMRGIVSLAAALALPLMINETEPFPQRNLIIFLTFCVIFTTLVLQGLTLRPLIQLFNLSGDKKELEDEDRARFSLATGIIEEIEENYSLSMSSEVLNQIKSKYEIRIQRIRKDVGQQRMDEEQIREFYRIQMELLRKERTALITLLRNGEIGDEVMRRLEYELDLEETRLMLEVPTVQPSVNTSHS